MRLTLPRQTNGRSSSTKPSGGWTDDEFWEAGIPLVWDNTMRGQFIQCPRHFYFAHRGLVPVAEPVYFAFGKAWGELLNEWHLIDPETRKDVTSLWDELDVEKLVELLWSRRETTVDLESEQTILKLFRRYIAYFPADQWETVLPEGGWVLPFTQKYSLGGALDALMDTADWGRVFREDKTTGLYLSDKTLLQWRFSPQITGYFWYGVEMIEDFRGIILNVACKKLHNGQTPQFKRLMETRTGRQLQEWREGWHWLFDSIERCYSKQSFPALAGLHCTGGYGRAACLFREVCQSGIEPGLVSPATFPFLSYREERWEPWRRGEKKEVTDVAV